MYRLARTLDRLLARIEGATVLDPIAETVAGWAQHLAPAGPVRDGASGTPTAHPLHPPLTAVSIGSLSAGTLLALTDTDSHTARRIIGAGLLAALPTAYAGASDWSYTAGAERRVGLIHAAVNDLALACYAAGWYRLRPGRRRHGRILSVTAWLLMATGGMIGGHLSYGMGVGVDTSAFQHLDLEWTDVAADSDVPESGMIGTHAAGIPVLLARHAGTIVAMVDRCTHRGGPLHEGTLCGGSVECPWHGSRFELADGSVATGPAVRPQPTFAVRVVDGRVQISRAEQRSLRSRPVT